MLYAVYRLPSFYTISYTLIQYTLYIYTLILKMFEWQGLNMATHSGTTLAKGLTDRICQWLDSRPRLGSSSVMIITDDELMMAYTHYMRTSYTKSHLVGCITSLFNQQSPLYHINHCPIKTRKGVLEHNRCIQAFEPRLNYGAPCNLIGQFDFEVHRTRKLQLTVHCPNHNLNTLIPYTVILYLFHTLTNTHEMTQACMSFRVHTHS